MSIRKIRCITFSDLASRMGPAREGDFFIAFAWADRIVVQDPQIQVSTAYNSSVLYDWCLFDVHDAVQRSIFILVYRAEEIVIRHIVLGPFRREDDLDAVSDMFMSSVCSGDEFLGHTLSYDFLDKENSASWPRVLHESPPELPFECLIRS